MMHGYGIGALGGPPVGGLIGNGWMVSGVMGLGFLILVGLAIWLAVSLSRQGSVAAGQHAMSVPVAPVAYAPAPPATPPAYDPAMAVARERFARGEIDLDAYNAIVTALRG